MPTILFIFGLRFFFYSDDHEPIHVHVVSSDGKAKFDLSTGVKLIYNRGLKSKDLKRATAICQEYREEFIQAWQEFFSTDDDGSNN